MQGWTNPSSLVVRANKWGILAPNSFVMWHAVVELVEPLRFEPEGRGFGIFH
jgi:hypothetical protein